MHGWIMEYENKLYRQQQNTHTNNEHTQCYSAQLAQPMNSHACSHWVAHPWLATHRCHRREELPDAPRTGWIRGFESINTFEHAMTLTGSTRKPSAQFSWSMQTLSSQCTVHIGSLLLRHSKMQVSNLSSSSHDEVASSRQPHRQMQ